MRKERICLWETNKGEGKVRREWKGGKKKKKHNTESFKAEG